MLLSNFGVKKAAAVKIFPEAVMQLTPGRK